MPQIAAWVATAAINSIMAITGNAALALAVGNFIGGFASWRGIAQLALLAFSLTRKPPRIADPGIATTFRADANAARRFVFGEMGTAGVPVYASTYLNNRMLVYCSAVSAGECEGFQSFTIDGSAVTLGTTTGVHWRGNSNAVKNGKFAERMWIVPRTGDGSWYNGFGLGSYGYAPEWDNRHKLTGVSHYFWFLYYDKNVYTNGVPEPLAIFRGQKCYDPRKDSTYPGGSGSHRINAPSSWEWTQCGPLIALKWALGIWQNGYLIGGLGLPAALLDLESFAAAANVADSNLWQCNGMVTAEDDKAAVMAAICATFGGEFVSRAGRLGVTYGAAQVSIITLTDDDVAGALRLDNSRTLRERRNTITARYVEPNDRYSVKPTDPVTNATYVAEDGGLVRPREVDLSLVTNRTQAVQLAALRLANIREHRAISGTFKPIARVAVEGKALTINSSALGVNEKYIVEKRSLDSDGSVRLELRLETDGKYPWVMDLTQAAPTPRALIPFDPTSVEAPVSWIAAGINEARAGAPFRALRVTGSNNEALAAATVIEYRLSGATDWTPGGEYLPTVTSIEIPGLLPGVTYDVSVAYRVAGAAEIITSRLVLPSVKVPADPTPPRPTEFAVYQTGNLLLLRATRPNWAYEIDVEFRVGNDWASALLMTRGDRFEVLMPVPVVSDGSNRYQARTVTRYGSAYSETGLFFDLDRAEVPGINELSTTNFRALDWPGALHDLTPVGPSGSKALTLDAVSGVRKPFGDYIGEIDLGGSFFPEVKIETSAGRDPAPDVTLAAAASIALLDASDWKLYTPSVATTEVSLSTKISIDKAPSDLVAAARLKSDLVMSGGVIDALSSGATFAECWRANGLVLSASSSVGWSGAFGLVLTLMIDVRPSGAISADFVLLELAAADGGVLKIAHNQSTGKLRAIDDNGAFVELAAPAWSSSEPVTIGLAQNGATRALAYWGRDGVVNYAEGLAASIGSIIGVSLSPSAGGLSLLEASTLTLSAASAFTLASVGGAALSAPFIVAELEIRSTPYAREDFEQATRRGPAGFGPYRELVGSDYKFRRASIWQRIAVTESYGDPVKIDKLTLTADMPDRFDGGTAAISVGGTRINFAQAFTTAPTQINVSLVSGSTAVKAEVVSGSIDISGFTAIARDGGGASVAASISWQARGR